MSRFVVDSSVAAAWCLADETNDQADGILERLTDEQAVVPALWIIEMANVLVVAQRKGRIDPDDVDRAVGMLLELPIEIEAAEPDAMGRLYRLARKHELSAYDAAYLDLATRNGLALATFDADLTQAAGRAGVTLLV